MEYGARQTKRRTKVAAAAGFCDRTLENSWPQ